MHVTEAPRARGRTGTAAQRLAMAFRDLVIREEDANRLGG